LRRAAWRLAACASLSGVTLIALDRQAPSTEAIAEGLFKTGQERLASGDYAAALQDFETAAKTYPTAAIADNALVEAARIRFLQLGDVEGARLAIAKVKTIAGSDAAASAEILAARMNVAVRRAPNVIDATVLDLERIPTRYPAMASAFPEAAYYAAEVERLGRRTESALVRYYDVLLRYSRSERAAHAYVGVALSSLRLGRPEEAIDALQRMRLRFPSHSLAKKAMQWNALIYRLYLRGTPYTKVAERAYAARMDPTALAVAPDGAVWVVASNGAFPTAESQSAHQGFASFNRAIYAHGPRGIVVASSNAATDERGTKLRFELPAATTARSAQTQILSAIRAIAVTSLREFIVADDDKGLGRFAADGRAKSPAIPGRADRVAVDPDDNVAVLTRGSKTVQVLNPDDQLLYTLGHDRTDIQDAFDLDVDDLGHWYVLDRNQRAVYVFGPTGGLVVRIASSGEEFRSAKAIAVDAEGRLHVYDERQSRIFVYQ
jgi:outer membrane protein assembly factor BamD (BamD/ComL family)